MIYSLTDKLSMEGNPQIEIMGKVVTVKNDAKTVLALMDAVNSHGEIEGAMKAMELLFSEDDQKIIDDLALTMPNYTKVISTAMSLAVGDDPDKEKPAE